MLKPAAAPPRFTSRWAIPSRTPAAGQANSDLPSRAAQAGPTTRNPGDPGYGNISIVPREYRSLRSTRRVVYFSRGNTIQRIAANAPRIDMDFEAFALEAAQAIQNLNNTVALAAGKGVIVRGFARLGSNRSGLAGFDVPAQLRVYHAPKVEIGQAIPVEADGCPFVPVQTATVIAGTALPNMRTNLNSTYPFDIPESVVREGELRFEFVLNPGRSVPETGADPLANNTARAGVDHSHGGQSVPVLDEWLERNARRL